MYQLQLNKLLGVGALVLAGTACQPQTASNATQRPPAAALPRPVAVPAAGQGAILAGSPAASAALPADTAATTALATKRSAAWLRRYDLAALFQSVDNAELPAAGRPMDGFFGPERYRIELIISRVTRNPKQPSYYLVQGKDRYKGRITPFIGHLHLTEVQAQPELIEPWPTDQPKLQRGSAGLFTVLGSFVLRETAGQRGAGVFRGRVLADVSLESDGTVGLQSRSTETLTQGSGILYDGTWTNAATGQTKPVTWVYDITEYHGPQVFQHLVMGGRSQEFNPKYAKLGWQDYWENQQWWVDSTEATAKHPIPTLFAE